MNIPLLRRSVRDTTGSVYTSPTLASQYNQMANWNRRLGRSFGMKEPFEFKMLRRAVAAVLPGKSPLTPGQGARGLTKPVAEGERSQAMGHVNGSIHERSYRNQIIDADIVSAFLETPSDEATMKLMGHISLTRDPMHLSSLLLYSAVKYETTRKLLRRKGSLKLARRRSVIAMGRSLLQREKSRMIRPCKLSSTRTQGLERTTKVSL
jgi:hypothetical protein